jgi:ribonuclease-3
LDPYVNFKKVETEVISYKSLLIEHIQKQRKTFRYDVIDEQGSGRNRFSVAIYVDGEEVAQGSGQSKKSAEEAASRAAAKTLNIGSSPRARRH